MNFQFAEESDAPLIHEVMRKAFIEYKDETPPSSALEETVTSIKSALRTGEQCLIGFADQQPVGLVRFQLVEEGLYFYRLSVVPQKRGQGIAKRLLQYLEDYARSNSCSSMLCKVRLAVPRNIAIYQSLGYVLYKKETLNRPNGVLLEVGSMQKKLQ